MPKKAETKVEVKETPTVKTKLELMKMERAKQRELIKNISPDLGILMFNNCANSVFFYKDENTNQTYEMEYGETEWFTFQEVKNIKNRHRNMLEKYCLIPIDIEDTNYELIDVLKILGIDKLYENSDYLFEGNVDYILKDLDVQTFSSLVNASLADKKKKAYLKRVIDRALELAIKGEFNDFEKMRILEDVLGDEEHTTFNNAIENYKNFGV